MNLKPNFIARLTNIIPSIMLKLHVWILRWTVRKSEKVRFSAIRLTMYRVRVQFGLPLPGDDADTDVSIVNVVRLFFEGVYPGGTENGGGTPGKLSRQERELYEWLVNDHAAKEAIGKTLQALHLSATTLEDKESERIICSRHQSMLNKTLEPIDFPELDKMCTSLRKQALAEYRRLQESKAQLLNIALKDVALMLPLFSVALFAAGYFHTSIFYGYFGVDTTLFFSTTDYLVSGVNYLGQAGIALVGLVLGLMYAHRNKNTETIREAAQSVRAARFLEVSVWLSCAIWAVTLGASYVILVVRETPLPPGWWGLFWAQLWVLFSFVGLLLAPRIAGRYFRNSSSMTVVIMVTVVFFAVTGGRTHLKISQIENGEHGRKFHVETLTREFSGADYTLLGISERYVFLLDREGGGTEIIPRERVRQITMSSDE